MDHLPNIMAEIVLLAAVAVYTLVGCVWDIKDRRLPNWLTVPMFFAGIIFHSATGGFAGLGFSLGGFALGFGILFLLMIIGGGSAGDVKFMGALGAWAGWKLTLYIFIGSGLVAAIFMALAMLWNLIAKPAVQSSESSSSNASEPAKKQRSVIPYAVPASIAAWIVLGASFTLNLMAKA